MPARKHVLHSSKTAILLLSILVLAPPTLAQGEPDPCLRPRHCDKLAATSVNVIPAIGLPDPDNSSLAYPGQRGVIIVNTAFFGEDAQQLSLKVEETAGLRWDTTEYSFTLTRENPIRVHEFWVTVEPTAPEHIVVTLTASSGTESMQASFDINVITIGEGAHLSFPGLGLVAIAASAWPIGLPSRHSKRMAPPG